MNLQLKQIIEELNRTQLICVKALEAHIRGEKKLQFRFISDLLDAGLLIKNAKPIYRGISSGPGARASRSAASSWSLSKKQAILKSKSYTNYDDTSTPLLMKKDSGGYAITKKGYWLATGGRFEEEQEVIVYDR